MPEKTPANSDIAINAQQFAGFGARLGALLIDGLVLGIPLYLLAYVLSNDFDRNVIDQEPPPTTLYHIFRVGFCWLYFSILESSRYQATLGKLIFKLKVFTEQHKKLSFTQSTVRYFAKVISITIFGLGGIMAIFTKKKQAFHDLAVQSVVVKNSTIFGKKPAPEANQKRY